MPVVTLTDISIRNLKPEGGKQVTYIDRSLKGFGVRVSKTGHSSFVLVMGANRQRVKIGDVGVLKLADARTAAKTMLAEKQLGHYRASRSGTYRAAVERFLEDKEPELKPRTYRDYKRLLTRHGFKDEKLSDLTPHDIQNKLAKLPPSEKFHAYVALNIFFRWAFRRHLIDRNPMERMDAPPKSKARKRKLTDAEIVAVWNACTEDFGDIIKLCLLLGQRRSEIAALQWAWIKDDLITLPAEITKNKREHTFPVGLMAKAIIEARPRLNTSPYLFPARKLWRGRATYYNAWSKDAPKLREASQTSGWVPHDLRRSLRSKFSELKVLREVSEKYINHISGTQAGVEGVYDRYEYLEEMRDAATRYEAHIAQLLQ